jgi:D-alanine transaminase
VPEIACVNGEFMPLENATVHVEDRGFQFADAVYEVVRTYDGRPFAVAEHMQRLFRSLEAINLAHAFTSAHLESLIHEAVRRAALPEANIYLQISRGQAKRHRGIPVDAAPTLVITVRPLESFHHLRQTGVKLLTVPDIRWGRCDIKSVGLLANVLAYQAAKQSGANDALFCETDGTVNETTAGNIFIAANGQIITPPKGPRLLSGVTRDKMLQAAAATGIPTVERRVTKAELLAADEVFITSTSAEVVPVVMVDGKEIGPGTPGPIAAKIYEQFTRLFVTASA